MISQILEFLKLLLLILLSFTPLVISRSSLELRRGESLSVERKSDFITSPDNTFTCGFYNLGTNAYWFAIWFTSSRNKTVVWTANRDRPVNGKGSKATIRKDGTMVLTDVDGTVAWQTNTTSFDIETAELLNTGNLVLRNPQAEILWQSFDVPTDTLLPTQNFVRNTRLTSSMRRTGFESGYFNLYFGSDNVLRLISDSPDTSISYWPNPEVDVYTSGRTNYNSSRIAVLDEMGRFLSSDLLHFNASDMGYGIKRRLTLDYDGNLRVYSLINATGLWEITWQALQQPCNVKGVCGKNAICVYTQNQAKCMCPLGFEVEDPNDWNSGCKPMFNQTLLNSRQVKFVELFHTDFWGFDLNSTSPLTLETCRNMCLEDFRCQAFSYRLLGQGVCYIKSALFNGYGSPDFPASIYLKLPANFPTVDIFHDASNSTCGTQETETLVGSPSMYDFNSRNLRWAYGFSFAGCLGAIELIFVLLGWWFLFGKHGIPTSVETGYRMISNQFRRYDYSELKKSTNNFREELGRGASGAVFKGILSDGRIVAVKRLGGDVFQAQDEYSAEISTLGKINHMNLVRMWGFCLDRRHRMLVYEFVENLSLDKHLFGSNFINWKQRVSIALGTAKGLTYLHHECLEWVIHCDVKPENILLDCEFQPKIADFGLAKLLQRGGAGSAFTRIRGTKGYMAPEWALNQPITAKVDVFGYGVVILEMVRGIKLCNWDAENESELTSFVRETKKKIENESLDWVESIVDSRLEGKYSRKQAAALIQTGICCVEEDRNKRPTMASVVQTLLECEDDTE